MILDSQQYYYQASKDTTRSRTDYHGNTATVYDNNYQYSDLRKFLNVDLYNAAFNSTEASRIQTSTIYNSETTTGYSSNSYACENTQDKIFAPSYREVTASNYGYDDDCFSYDTVRQLKVTDYAACMGCERRSSSGDSYDGCGYWWLRSPSDNDSSIVRCVYYFGMVNTVSDVYCTSVGVVPALRLQ